VGVPARRRTSALDLLWRRLWFHLVGTGTLDGDGRRATFKRAQIVLRWRTADGSCRPAVSRCVWRLERLLPAGQDALSCETGRSRHLHLCSIHHHCLFFLYWRDGIAVAHSPARTRWPTLLLPQSEYISAARLFNTTWTGSAGEGLLSLVPGAVCGWLRRRAATPLLALAMAFLAAHC